MRRKTYCDPFRGYPKPRTPRCVRFSVWLAVAALLGWLVIMSVME